MVLPGLAFSTETIRAKIGIRFTKMDQMPHNLVIIPSVTYDQVVKKSQ